MGSVQKFSTFSDQEVLGFIDASASSEPSIERDAKDVQDAYREASERGLQVGSEVLARWVTLVGKKTWWPDSYYSPKQEVMAAA